MSKMTFLDFNTHSEGSDWSSKSWIVCFSGIMCFLGHPFCRPVPSLFTLVDFFVSEIMSEMGVLDLKISGDAEAQIFPFSFPFFPSRSLGVLQVFGSFFEEKNVRNSRSSKNVCL